ncbi:MAG: DUF4138 domain-containing protein [Bacteroidales bacterium]|nr:DUF4138 domain-containing protein [Bacteroidales bacterium]
MNVYGGNYTDGDRFEGLTRKVGFDRMIPPHALEVCYNKTTHIIFPAEITYVDLGNENLVAGLADVAKNVLRVKSAFKSFKQETNLPTSTPTASAASLDVPPVSSNFAPKYATCRDSIFHKKKGDPIGSP